MIKFLRKFEDRSIKMAQVHLILITKSTNLPLFTLFLYRFEIRCDLRQYSVVRPEAPSSNPQLTWIRCIIILML